MALEFFDESLVVEYVHVQRDEVVKENGILKEIIPLAIVGKKESLESKSLESIYLKTMESVLPMIVSNIAEKDAEVLVASEVEILNVYLYKELSKKNVKIMCVSQKCVLDKFSDLIICEMSMSPIRIVKNA